jgi:hypothetical protein
MVVTEFPSKLHRHKFPAIYQLSSGRCTFLYGVTEAQGIQFNDQLVQ